MAPVSVFLCFCLCFQIVLCQFGFYPREERRFPSPFGFTQNFIPNSNRFRNTLSNVLQFRPQTPADNPQYIYPFQNRPVNNQYDQYVPNNQNNRPNNVRFPNGGAQVVYDNVNQPNNPAFVERPIEVPQNPQIGYGFENGANNNDQSVTNNPEVVDEGNVPNSGNEGTYGTIVSGEQSGPDPNAFNEPPTFVNINDEPKEEPPTLPATSPTFPQVPVSESRNNFDLDAAGLFPETCPTVDNGLGSCLNIKSCPPYVKLLEQAKSNSAAVQVLRKAHCGFDGNVPKVCCPFQSIPELTSPAPVTEAPTPAPSPAPTSAPDVASGKSLISDFISAFPAPPECGVSNGSFSRVVGGVNAKLGDFPWMALLGYKGKRSPTTSWLCGGSLITQHHVLTAAHCIHNHEDDLYVVRVGELDLATEDEGATPVDVLIKSKIKHEGYNSKAFTNDIGLLILENDVQFTDLIKPICIPTDMKLRTTDFEDYNPFIAGWGDLEFRGPKATHLQVLQLPVVSNDFCRKAYTAYKAQVIDERVLCAGFKRGGKDSCQGDSGGPLMQPIYNFENATTYFYQIGVVSFGKKCAEPGFPGVYSRVTSFVPWLQKNVLGTE